MATLTPWSDSDEWDWQIRSLCSSTSSSEWYTGTYSAPPPGSTFSCSWSLSVNSNGGSLDISQNGSPVVSQTSNSSGSFTIVPGDLISINVSASAMSPLIAQSILAVYDNGVPIYTYTEVNVIFN